MIRPPSSSRERVRLALVGAGPQSLALMATLVERDPRWRDEAVVLDGSGRWLTGWRHRFASHEITSLRSAGVHHPHPDPQQLYRHAKERDRLGELAPPYDQPSTDLFDHFCDRVVEANEPHGGVRQARVASLEATDDRSVRVVLGDGTCVVADRVVVATNPFRPRLPEGLAAIAGDASWCHSDQVDLRRIDELAGRRVDVVGGGLTAVQLACGAARRGATVRLVARRPLVTRSFDVDAGWLGPRHLDDYARCCPAERRRLVDEARGGGSVPAHDRAALGAAGVDQRVAVAAAAEALGGDADTVWFATGGRLDAATDPMLAELHRTRPVAVHDGLPEVTASLAWPGTSVHLMGGYAALELGPAARNLWGARLAARRIADAVAAT